LAIADFTVVESPVTIKGEVLKHSLFHLRLPASGWTYVQVTYGGVLRDDSENEPLFYFRGCQDGPWP